MKPLVLLFVLLVGGCAGSPVRIAMTSPEAQAKEDDTKCRDFGAQPGTQAYFDCRMRLDQRRADTMSEYRASLDEPGPVAPDSNYPRIDPSAYSTMPNLPQQQKITCTSRPNFGQTTTTCQ